MQTIQVQFKHLLARGVGLVLHQHAYTVDRIFELVPFRDQGSTAVGTRKDRVEFTCPGRSGEFTEGLLVVFEIVSTSKTKY